MSNNRQKSVAAYCRIGHGDGFALTQQMSTLLAFAPKHIGQEISFKYSDMCSGRPNRGSGLHELMMAARHRQFDTLIVYSVTRLARDPSQGRNIITELARNGVHVVSVLDDINTLMLPTN